MEKKSRTQNSMLSPSDSRVSASDRGKKLEAVVLQKLLEVGWSLKYQNFRPPNTRRQRLGELDLVVVSDTTNSVPQALIVEVKSGRDLGFEVLSPTQRKRLEASRLWLTRELGCPVQMWLAVVHSSRAGAIVEWTCLDNDMLG